MSKPWKGWMLKEDEGGPVAHDCVAVWVFAKPAVHKESHPVVVTIIDDESLPHPGDGRIWETKAGTKVEVLSAPVEGVVIVKGLYGPDGSVVGYDIASLRERKPEPKHEEWCNKVANPLVSWSGTRPPNLGCTCERRSGEERRAPKSIAVFVEGETGGRLHLRAGTGNTRLWRDSRDGTDRRAS